MSTLFDQLSAMRSTRVPCALQSAAEVTDPQTGIATVVRLPGSEPILFEIQQVSPDELTAADAILDAAKPPAITRSETRPGTVGATLVQEGYDWDHPDYIAERQRLLVKRNALLCIYGCPALMESTPGVTPMDKAEALLNGIGSMVLSWLSTNLEKMTMFTGVGETEVALFLAGKSGDAKSSSDSKDARRGGKRAKSSSGSTAQRSTTKNGKRPVTGK